jgi:hypothetical protein
MALLSVRVSLRETVGIAFPYEVRLSLGAGCDSIRCVRGSRFEERVVMKEKILIRPLAVAKMISAIGIVACGLGACAVSPGKMGEPRTLHAGEVVQVLSRAEILATREVHPTLKAAGIDDASIQDASVVVVRLLCCGPPQTSTPVVPYNPKLPAIKVGDVVEVELGGGSTLNTVTRVLQGAGQSNGSCWWDPKNELLWRRVMYCDWMPEAGWVRQDGLYTGWYKPAKSP